MTREEAIERIKMILEEATANEDAVSYVTSYDAEALDMAIKALEQEPCEDAISRQAVLGILKDKWNMFSDANDAMQESIETIEAFPPVTPQPKTGHWLAVEDEEGNIAGHYCSECDLPLETEDKTMYCPHCGCRMTEVWR